MLVTFFAIHLQHQPPTRIPFQDANKSSLFRTNPPDGKILLQSVEIIFEIAIEFLI